MSGIIYWADDADGGLLYGGALALRGRMFTVGVSKRIAAASVSLKTRL